MEEKNWHTFSAQFNDEELDVIEQYIVDKKIKNRSELVKFAIATTVGIIPIMGEIMETPKLKAFNDYIMKGIEKFFNDELSKDPEFITLAKEMAEELKSRGQQIDWTDFMSNIKPFVEHNPVGRPSKDKKEPKRY